MVDGANEVATILDSVPEFADGHYLALVEDGDGVPSAPEVFTELADFVAELVANLDSSKPQLARCLAAVEQVAAVSPEAEELVGWAFLDSLGPDDLRAIGPWLGRRTRELLEEMEAG